jgi:glycosyltransferase involved in cell wall biosynthesis
MTRGQLKILYLTPEYPGETDAGGLATYTANISRGLAGIGHEVHVLVCTPGLARRDMTAEGVALHFRPVPHLRWPRHLPSFWATRSRLATATAFLNEYRGLGRTFDVIHASEFMAPALRLARLAPALVIRLSAPASLILECDGLPLGRDNIWADKLERRAARQADVVVCPSHLLERRLRSSGWLDERPVVVVHSPVAGDAWSGLPPADRTEPTVLAVGRLDHAKGLDVLIDALAKLTPDVPGLQLVLAGRTAGRMKGQTYADFLAERAANLGVACTFVGERQPVELRGFYADARVVAMASRFDSWGNVALEALAAGRPVVCTTGTGVSELVGRLDPAAIAPVDDAARLAESLRRYLVSPALAADVGQRGRDLVTAEFSVAGVAQRMEAVYEEAIASSAKDDA